MSKKYGYFYEEELDKWEHLPATMLVLTSSYMGAWLLRRDERKGNRELIEELEKLREIYKKLADESVKNHSKGDYYIGKSAAYGVAISSIDERIAKLKGGAE